MDEIKVQWHSGFVAAVDLELSANRNDLTYEREYNLNTKPLEIDLLVIKKESHVRIANEIGRLFRGHNIMEYKSPEDHLNIDTFYKAEAYACLYKSYGRTVDERKAEDITVSIVRKGKPQKLFRYFKEHGIRMENPYKGIYYVSDGVLFPTQIIVAGDPEGPNHTWLRALSDNLKKQELKNLLERIDGLEHDFDRELADAVLEVSVQANKKIVEELKGDESVCQALLEIMEPEINKIAAEAAEKAAKKAAKKAAEEAAKKAAEEADKKATKRTNMEIAAKMLKAGKLSTEEVKIFFPELSLKELQTTVEKMA